MKKQRFISGFSLQRRRVLRRRSTLIAAFVIVVALAATFVAVRGRAAGERFPWPTTLSKIFGSRTASPLSPPVFVDVVGDYRSAATGNWNAIATWERFDGASWVAAVATPTSADGVITIRSPHVVTISASGLTYDQVVVDAGGQVTVASTITSTLANGAGTDLTINGTWLNSGGTWTVTGTAWTVGAGGTYIHNTASSAATPLGLVTLDPASTWIYRGSSAPLVPAISTSGRTYGNLILDSSAGSWSNAASAASGAGTLTVNGDFTVGSGVTFVTTQTGAMTFAGNFTNNGTITNSTGTQIYTFTGSGKTISGSGAIGFETWNVNSGASITLGTGVSIGAGFTGTISGTLTAGTNQITAAIGATATIAINGTFKTANSNGFSGSSSTTISSTNTPTITLGASSTIEYNGASSQSISARTDYANLTLSGNRGAGTITFPSATVGLSLVFQPNATNVVYSMTGNTIEFNNASNQQTIPIFNYNNLASSGTGGRTLINGSGTIGIAGTFATGNNLYDPTTSTVEYNGTSAQQLTSPAHAFKYYKLSINNSAGVTAPDPGGPSTYVTDTLFLKLGVFTLAANSNFTLTDPNDATKIVTIDRSAGSITPAPVFGTKVNVTYSDSSLTTTGPEIPTSATVLNNLTISDAAGVTLNADAQVNNQLIFTSGILFSGDKILTLGGSASSTGAGTGKYVDGYLQKLTPPVPFTFDVGNGGYSPVTIDTLVGSDTVKARAFNAYHPQIIQTTKALQRYWQLTKGGALISAFITFNYLQSDVGTSNEAIYTGYKFEGTTTTIVPVVPDATNNKARTTLTQTGFSFWTLAEPATQTAVRLRSFQAARYSDGVELNWESGFEVNNLGYLLYREQNGQRSRVTPSIVAGSALTVGPGNRLTAGYSYSWFDPQGTGDSAYSLEAIDLDGSSQWAGPVYPYVGPKGGQTRREPRHERAMLLSEIAADDRDQSSVRSWPCVECGGLTPLSGGATYESPVLERSEVKAELSKAEKSGVEPPHSKENVEPPHSKVQQSIAAGKAVKIKVRKSGWYRVTQAELVAAGFDPSSDARMLQLFVDGEEVPISLSTESSRLSPNDTLEFYGVPLDTPTTDTRVYWLVSGSSAGKRMIARRGKLKTADQYSETVSGSFDVTIERSEKLVYFASLLNGDTPNIFGASVRPEPVTQTLVAKNVDRDSVSQPRLEVALQGLTTGNHSVQLQVNGTGVGTMTFVDREHPVARFSVGPALLREGDNVVSLVSMNGQSDVSLIDWVRLTYPHQYKAENNALTFSALGGQAVRIDGFTGSNVRVVDVTNPNSPAQLSASASTSEGSYAVKVQPVGSGVRTLIAFTDDLMAHPVSVTANQPSNWNAPTNGADMVILTHKDFRQAIEPLANLRRSQGLSVAVVDVEDVYDEFSYGAHTPAAIKSFLTTAAANWSRKPAYLLLVGDSSWDPRNYLNQGDNDFVPTKLIDTQALETGSDDWLADFNGLGLTSMAVGRLPARTAAEANLMVSKIMSYEQERELNAPLRGAVMVSDNGFETQSSQTRSLLPSNVTVQTINRADVGNDDIMRGQIVDALNQGPMIVNYYGHGSVRVWTGEGLLSADLAGNLTNANRLSVYVMMTCLNGYAIDASNINSLGEAVLKAQNGGAVAVWASSGFTTPQPQFEMNSEFYRLLFGGQPMRLGDAARNAKAATSDIDVRRTWILLGDPAMRVR